MPSQGYFSLTERSDSRRRCLSLEGGIQDSSSRRYERSFISSLYPEAPAAQSWESSVSRFVYDSRVNGAVLHAHPLAAVDER